MKDFLKHLIVTILGWQVRRLYKKNDFKSVGVVGSYGKTSTKIAIAQLISKNKRVQYQDGNYNDIVSVPLIFFGLPLPSLFNPFAWMATFIAIEKQLYKPYPYDVVVLELGTDGIGQIEVFKKYLKLDVSVVTSIGPEHMEFFKTLENVAKEEFFVSTYSDYVFANRNLIDRSLIEDEPKNVIWYEIEQDPVSKDKWSVRCGKEVYELSANINSEAEVYSITSAACVAYHFGFNSNQINTGIQNIRTAPGRLNRLEGLNGSTIIDDTYNSSPEAVEIALKSLSRDPAKTKIALLGNMNELGELSAELHTQVGKLCVPNHFDLIVTLGLEANEYLANEAEKRGCKVIRTDTPYEAGKVIKEKLGPDVAVLAKGSQNGVYAEEAVKMWLKNDEDSKFLVRQSPSWLKKKQVSFVHFDSNPNQKVTI